jgi:GntR family transcriptional regulator/MocR family aminotransferase
MGVHITLGSGAPLGQEIYRQLREAILDGRLREGDALPASRELAASLGVSRNTVTSAYLRLGAEGFVSGHAGAGTHVSGGAATRRRRAPAGDLEPLPFWRRPIFASSHGPRPSWDFEVGVPDAALFPWVEWRRLVARELRPGRSLGGRYAEAAGHAGLRAAIARHAGIARSVRAGEEDVLVTSGAQQALDLAARVLLAPGTCVAVEEPGYPPARAVFESYGARVVPVRVDAEGLDVEALPSNARLVYVTPSHQFPLGTAMSLPRRLALLAWAERHGAALVEDDYDSEFRFDGRPLEPLQNLDRAGRVIYVGTFSKVLLPTLRVGFLVAPASLFPALAAAKAMADWHVPPETQAALQRLVDDGLLARHVKRALRVYRERRERLLDSLERRLGGAFQVLASSAGLHIATFLSDRRLDASALARRARAANVGVQALAPFYAAAPRAGLALGVGSITASRIDEGIRRLAACVGTRR